MRVRNWTGRTCAGLLPRGGGRERIACQANAAASAYDRPSATTFGARVTPRALSLLLSVGVLGVSAERSWAHAHLQQATPAEGSTVHGNPVEVTLQFTQELEPALSGASVLGEKGEDAEAGRPMVDPAKRRILHVPLKASLSGTYHVIWHAVSVDSHESKGQYTFTVAP